MADLSILIPARNEMFLSKTIDDILENIEGDTEIIAVLDGAWTDPGIRDHPRVTLIYYPESIGQRAATNQAARLSNAKYVMKVDAHCSFDKGFDVKMMNEMKDDWTMVPLMRNLHAFDWVCKNGHRRYQSPSGPCLKCGKETERDVVWIAKKSPQSVSYCFDSTPHFQYFKEFAKRPEGKGDITETMSLQGSCWMLTREKYFELNVCDEKFGSWGSQGIEVACKTWLSGGKVMVNKKTWYAHLFRTQGGDFGFPYPMSGKAQKHAQNLAKDLFFNNKWEKQIHPLSWLVEKFWPVKGWTEEDLKQLKELGADFFDREISNKSELSEPSILSRSTSVSSSPPESSQKEQETEINKLRPEKTDPDRTSPIPGRKKDPAKLHPNQIGTTKNGGIILKGKSDVALKKSANSLTKGIIFYTDNRLKLKIAHAVQSRLRSLSTDLSIPIVSSSLKPMPHMGVKNIYFPNRTRGYLTMFMQILAAIENSNADILYFCEHDILYTESHFAFTPQKKDIYYYNQNFWKLRVEDGHALHYDANQLNGMCCYRELALEEYRKRVEIVKKEGYRRNMGFEPGTHSKQWESYKSEVPIIDIRHTGNLTKNRWSIDEFRNKNSAKGWIETDDEIPGWGSTKDLIKRLN